MKPGAWADPVWCWEIPGAVILSPRGKAAAAGVLVSRGGDRHISKQENRVLPTAFFWTVRQRVPPLWERVFLLFSESCPGLQQIGKQPNT